MEEQLEILRRIAERGLRQAEIYTDTYQVDLWVHMLDEIERAKLLLEPLC